MTRAAPSPAAATAATIDRRYAFSALRSKRNLVPFSETSYCPTAMSGRPTDHETGVLIPGTLIRPFGAQGDEIPPQDRPDRPALTGLALVLLVARFDGRLRDGGPHRQGGATGGRDSRSEEHTPELQSQSNL